MTNKHTCFFLVIIMILECVLIGCSSPNDIPQTYTVVIGQLVHGNIIAIPTTALAGTEITLIVNPVNGYRLKAGTLKYNATTLIDETTKKFVLPASNVIVTAEFEIIPQEIYTVVIGTLTNANGSTIIANPTYGVEGTEITLIINSADSYRLKAKTLKYNETILIDESTKKFTLPASNVSITAEFEIKPIHAISIGSLNHGTISTNPTNGIEGTTINLTIIPDDCYQLKRGTLRYIDESDHLISGTSFQMPDNDVIINAEFEPVIANLFVNGSNIAQNIGDDIDRSLSNIFSWLKSNAQDGDEYTIKMIGSQSIVPTNLTGFNNADNITITIMGISDSTDETMWPTIQLNGDYTLFTVGDYSWISNKKNIHLILDGKLLLKGTSDTSGYLIRVNSTGTLNLSGSVKITSNTFENITSTKTCGGVYVYEGIFNMNGGSISGNTTATASYSSEGAYGGGVYVNNGTFNMSGGSVSGNTVTAAFYNEAFGGGVYVTSGNFNMTGGTISGNQVTTNTSGSIDYYRDHNGGGVYIADGIFTKTGGVIYGSNGGNDSNNIMYYNNVMNARGAAIYFDTSHRRETTVTEYQNLSYNGSSFIGQWSD